MWTPRDSTSPVQNLPPVPLCLANSPAFALINPTSALNLPWCEMEWIWVGGKAFYGYGSRNAQCFLSCDLSNLVELVSRASSHEHVSMHPPMAHWSGWSSKKSNFFLLPLINFILFNKFSLMCFIGLVVYVFLQDFLGIYFCTNQLWCYGTIWCYHLIKLL